MLNIDEIRAVTDKATPGKWYGAFPDEHGFKILSNKKGIFPIGHIRNGDDVVFIINAQAWVPALCDEVENLQAENIKTAEIYSQSSTIQARRIAELEKENADLKQEIRDGRHMCAPIHLDGNGAQAFINAVDLSRAKQEIAVLKKALEMAVQDMRNVGAPLTPEMYIQRAKEEMKK